jgi:hypothetical protein
MNVLFRQRMLQKYNEHQAEQKAKQASMQGATKSVPSDQFERENEDLDQFKGDEFDVDSYLHKVDAQDGDMNDDKYTDESEAETLDNRDAWLSVDGQVEPENEDEMVSPISKEAQDRQGGPMIDTRRDVDAATTLPRLYRTDNYPREIIRQLRYLNDQMDSGNEVLDRSYGFREDNAVMEDARQRLSNLNTDPSRQLRRTNAFTEDDYNDATSSIEFTPHAERTDDGYGYQYDDDSSDDSERLAKSASLIEIEPFEGWKEETTAQGPLNEQQEEETSFGEANDDSDSDTDMDSASSYQSASSSNAWSANVCATSVYCYSLSILNGTEKFILNRSMP